MLLPASLAAGTVWVLHLSVMLIDSHCHLDFPDLATQRFPLHGTNLGELNARIGTDLQRASIVD